MLDRLGSMVRLVAALGAPGAIIGVLSLAACGFSLAVLGDEYRHPAQTGRAALHRLFEGWVRSDDYLGYTLVDRAEHWSRADSAGERERALGLIRRALADLGRALDRDDARFRLVRVDRLALGRPGRAALATWEAEPGLAVDAPAEDSGVDRVTVLGRPGGDESARVDLTVSYHVNAPVAGAIRGVEASYHRLVLALLGFSGYSLLCLGYMARHAGTQRERVAREAAAAATLDLADRTCHELGNVAFVVGNERRNLAGHIDLLERFVDQDADALRAATRRAGIEPGAAARLLRALRREYADRGIDPEFELRGSAAIAREVCQRIATCSDYIALTVRELDGHLRSAGAPVHLEPVRLDEVIHDALALLAPRIEAGGARIEVPTPPDAPPISVRADRRLLIHAVVNLVKNGIEAGTTGDRPAGPTIRLVAAVAEAPASVAILTITDDGPGIDPAQLRRIFRAGYTTKATGRGLGLSIARESIATQGGTLAVSSHPGTGTTFRIGLPLA